MKKSHWLWVNQFTFLATPIGTKNYDFMNL